MRLGRRVRSNRPKTRQPNLRCESLESRYLLTTFTVNTTVDVVDANDGVTSLREAINQANAAAGLDDVDFDQVAVGGAFIDLVLGELEITDSVNVNGLGNSLMGIRAIDPSDAVGDGFRIFNINDGTPANIEVLIADMQLVEGDSSGNGGTILSEESLTIRRIFAASSTAGLSGGFVFASLSDGAALVIDDTTIQDSSSEAEGGGVAAVVYGGSVNIVDSIITGNTAVGDGGGIYLYGDSSDNDISINNSDISGNSGDIGGGVMFYGADAGGARIEDSVISGNSARRGGGVFGLITAGSELSVERTLVLDNDADESGGGMGANVGGTVQVSETRVTGNRSVDGAGVDLSFTGAGTANVDSSAVDSNTATGTGGGLSIDFNTFGGNATVVSSTISGNTSASAPGLGTDGDGALSIKHSTIAKNVSTVPSAAILTTGQDVTVSHTIIADHDLDIEVNAGTLDVSFSLIGTNAGSGLTESAEPDANGNLIGGVTPIDPMLGDLGPNGGLTDTHALMAGSPAIDAGADILLDRPAFDQRGAPFIRTFDGDADGTATIDMGAYERISSGLVVDTMDDESDGDYTSGDLSLREAVALAADAASTSGTVTFDAGLSGQTLTLTMGQILINNPVVIQGLGAENLTISAIGNDPTPAVKQGDGSRVFEIDDGDVDRNLPVEVSGLTLTGGDVTGPGGAIYAREDLLLKDSVITGNHSALSADTAGFDGDGGGIWARTESGLIQIVNTTVENNTSDDDGGGLNVLAGNGTVSIENSTVTGNSASGLSATGPNLGGGIRGFADVDGEVAVINSTITGNSGETLGIGDSWGGGGIGFIGDGLLSVTNSTVSGNTSGTFGGGIYVDTGQLSVVDSTISDNSGSIGGGVGVFFDGTASIEGTTIDNNVAGDGGGIFNLGVLDITDSTISNNSGNFGGGIANGLLTQTSAFAGTVNILNSTISGNEGEFGGGLFNIADPATNSSLTFVTMTNNLADSNLDDTGSGGGIYTLYGNLDIDHSIIAGNQVSVGGAPDMEIDPNGIGGNTGTIALSNSLVGDNTGVTLAESVVPDPEGNIIGGPTDGVVDPLLGPLADNGGLTMTHALLEGSPAIDNGDAAIADAPAFDQRGEPFVRIFNGTIDMGAFELQPDTPTGDFNGDGNFDCEDIDALVIHIRDGMSDAQFDVNGDGNVDGGDVDEWLVVAGMENIGRPFLSGDATLNGIVDAQDLNVVGQAWLNEVSGWCAGDFNADGSVNASDLNRLGQNWQMGAPVAARAPRAALSASGVVNVVRVDAAIADLGRDSTVSAALARDVSALDSKPSFDPRAGELPRSQRRYRHNQYRIQGDTAPPVADQVSVVDELLSGWNL